METDIAVRLLKWSEEMGYVHRNGFERDSSVDFNKLCKDKTRRLWEDVISKVKPLSDVEHIRKNVLLSRIRKRNSQSHFEISGSLGQQIRMRHKLKQLQEQKQVLFHELETLESSIRNIQKNMTKKHTQASFIQNQLKQFQLKGEIMKIKKGECESFKSSVEDLNATAKSLFSIESESNKQPGLDVVCSRMEMCMKIVQDYQTWCKESAKAEYILEEEEYQAEQKERKEALWKGVSAVVGKIPSEQLWNSLLSHFMEKSVLEMSSLASSVDLKAELNTLREKGLNDKKSDRNLSATHIAVMTETANDLLEAEILSRKLELTLEKIVDGAQAKIAAETSATKPALFNRDTWLQCMRIRCRQIHLEAVKAALKEEVEEFRKKSLDLSSCAQRLKDEQSAIARLDDEIDEVKTMIEQGLRSINEVKSNLRRAQQTVIDQLDSFPEKCSFAKDIVSTSSEGDAINSSVSSTFNATQRSNMFNSTVHFNEGAFVCSTPAPNSKYAPPCNQSFRSDDTVLENASVDSTAPRKNLREIISTLRNALSKESKSFFKLPLDLVPKLKISESFENFWGLLVESPKLIACLACTNKSAPKQLMSLSAFMTTDTQMLFLHIYQNLGHLRASRLQQLSSPTEPTTLCAGLTQDYFRVTAPDQESNIREHLSQIVTTIENTKEAVAENRELFDIWVQRPVQGMIPDTLRVDGKTLKEWKKDYDALLAE